MGNYLYILFISFSFRLAEGTVISDRSTSKLVSTQIRLIFLQYFLNVIKYNESSYTPNSESWKASDSSSAGPKTRTSQRTGHLTLPPRLRPYLARSSELFRFAFGEGLPGLEAFGQKSASYNMTASY